MDQNFPILHCLVGSKMHQNIHNHFWIQPTMTCCVDDIINRPRRDVEFIEAIRMKSASNFKVLHIFKLFKPHSSEDTDIRCDDVRCDETSFRTVSCQWFQT